MNAALTRVQASLDALEQRQSAMLVSIEENVQSKARRIRSVLTALGVEIGKSDGVAGVGGPFVPVSLPKDANKDPSGFDRQIHRISLARAHMSGLTHTLGSVPLRRPVDGDVELASGFGVRIDPFTGSPAMHTGVDLHGDTGEPVRSTADGIVTAAGWSGGYGRVVDVDHGHGLATRYGHLSAIDVHVGQSVRAGQVIGKVGSTGRSTGPHLHYETRVRGEAVDPQKFLRAGAQLAGSL
jgi:murein DD-endopeptidase MepM/ murein hydrolase activator NlpD